MKLTKNFTLEEFERSETAKRYNLDNRCNNNEKTNLTKLCTKILEPLREQLGNYHVTVTSGFRSPEVNEKTGGVWNSQHREGKAADITTVDNKNAIEIIKTLDFDQLIIYRKFIHVSYNEGKNRKEIIYKNK